MLKMPFNMAFFIAVLLEHSSGLLEEVRALLEKMEHILEDVCNRIEMKPGLHVIGMEKSLAVVLLEQLNSLLEQEGGILAD